MFNVRLNLYKQRYFEWSEQKKAIEQIFIWMKQTVSPSYHKTCIAVTANWKEAYINLKEQVNQGRFISQRRIKDEYDQHLRSLKPSTRDLEAWITKWEELLLEAERKSMVIADDVLDWSTRFLDAIRPLDDAWTTAYEITIEEKIEDGTLTRRELANAFRRNLRKIRNRRPSRIYRGSFAVQEERMDDNSDEESYHYGRQPSRSLERKRGRTRSRSRSIGPPRKKKNQGPEQYQTTRPVCEACEGWHLLQFCYYLFKNLAPEEFIPRWGPRMRAKKFAEDHPDLVKKIKKMHLEEGASNAQDFVANLVSFYQLRKQGIWWDTRRGYNCLRGKTDQVLAYLKEKEGQFVLEYIKHDHPLVKTGFAIRRHRFNSWTSRKERKADANRWHARLGHPGPEVLKHLAGAAKGVRLTGISKGPTTVECESCGTSKAQRIIRREERTPPHAPGEHLAIDFHDFAESTMHGEKTLMLITDRFSGFMWDYYMTSHRGDEILETLKWFLDYLEKAYMISPVKIEMDNEIAKRPEVKHYLEHEKRIILQPSPAHTQALNGGAERSGAIIKTKGRSMRKGARLPFDLWPEIVRAAVYLYNRTPRYASNWKTPYDRFTTHAAWKSGIVIENQKPQLAHLKVYGCKAYALTTEYMKKENRLQRFNPRAWIGYLVGYDSTNVYRIWNPTTGRIIRTRDVIFNEDEVFSGNIEHLKDDLLHVSTQEITRLLTKLDLGTDADFDDEYADLIDHITDVVFDGDKVNIEPDRLTRSATGLGSQESSQLDSRNPSGPTLTIGEGLLDGIDKYTYPTPPETPPSALLAASITIVSNNDFDLHQSSALAAGMSTDGECTGGTLVQEATARERIGGAPSGVGTDRTGGSRADFEERTGGALDLRDSIGSPHLIASLDETIHGKQFPGDRFVRDLPPAPKSHREVETHPLGWLFEEAEKAHLKSHDPYGSWTTVPIGKAKGKQILDCMWIYVYKQDKKGRLVKCKARLVVRGDQEKRDDMRDTYAATLAARSFRTFMAIAARFDLELKQYDAVNAFVNAKLDEEIFMRMAPGYRESGKIYQLNKALYGLRRSPLLWQKELTSTLIKLGFRAVPHEPCCMLKSGVMLFFYVDDIVVAYKKSRQLEANSILNQLRAKYNISGGEDLEWFLGMRIIRDRSNKMIWLSQATYIDKIAKLADTQQADDTPMSREELLPYEGTATYKSQHQYQRKVGSIMYAAVSTRPDVAFAVSRLARFLSNPGPEHHKAADKVLCYLKRHRAYALRLGGGDDFSVSTDASFADNTLDRKSSQAYVMTLFGGTIGWQANKQDTRAKKDAPRLRTKLRHVDIHNHWVRQEVQNGDVQVHYMPTKDMIANGLTKALSRQEHHNFLKQIGVDDIGERLAPQQKDIENPDIEELLSLNDMPDNI
ncbi:conserved hypothetical protein [Talaromyces marneffei ATCC 18224]|uniref:Integrase catalytic domain-containing protein n=1 Tax=Talaromyces marneffei (strain ATCC 18224 / CBS 334.59 / QM 7333) TaxID=441960 RepID=B6Q997_TALMQ|nr:conserved hypothetical protein [Talaromyces marneffei ATCC 18224]